MDIIELEKILKTSNFQKHLENYITHEIIEKNIFNSSKNNPFMPEVISKKLILITIVKCTVIIVSMIYLMNKNSMGVE